MTLNDVGRPSCATQTSLTSFQHLPIICAFDPVVGSTKGSERFIVSKKNPFSVGLFYAAHLSNQISLLSTTLYGIRGTRIIA